VRAEDAAGLVSTKARNGQWKQQQKVRALPSQEQEEDKKDNAIGGKATSESIAESLR
jgi:hypothetical protein